MFSCLVFWTPASRLTEHGCRGRRESRVCRLTLKLDPLAIPGAGTPRSFVDLQGLLLQGSTGSLFLQSPTAQWGKNKCVLGHVYGTMGMHHNLIVLEDNFKHCAHPPSKHLSKCKCFELQSSMSFMLTYIQIWHVEIRFIARDTSSHAIFEYTVCRHKWVYPSQIFFTLIYSLFSCIIVSICPILTHSVNYTIKKKASRHGPGYQGYCCHVSCDHENHEKVEICQVCRQTVYIQMWLNTLKILFSETKKRIVLLHKALDSCVLFLRWMNTK